MQKKLFKNNIHVVVKSVIVHIFSDKSIPFAFIYGTDALSEGNFHLSSNWRGVTYSNWAGGEPNNCCGGEHCIVMHNDGQWNDVQCQGPFPAVCEIQRKYMYMCGVCSEVGCGVQ